LRLDDVGLPKDVPSLSRACDRLLATEVTKEEIDRIHKLLGLGAVPVVE